MREKEVTELAHASKEASASGRDIIADMWVGAITAAFDARTMELTTQVVDIVLVSGYLHNARSTLAKIIPLNNK